MEFSQITNLPPRAKDLTGRRFSRLTAVRHVGRDKWGAIVWECQCDCGNTVLIRGVALRSGGSRSCGCMHRQRARETCIARNTTHGRSASPEYVSWLNMRARCVNPNNPAYARYGGRGIGVCDRWTDSFEAFLSDMGEKPSPKHSIERLDNSRGYDPDNCVWADDYQQSQNKRNNRMLTHDGQMLCISEWSRHTGVSVSLLLHRIDKLGWGVSRALTTPVNRQRRIL